MRTLFALALAVVACSGSDRSSSTPAGRTVSPNPARGPDALILRVPRTGGTARVSAYNDLDSAIWSSTDNVPAIDRVLAFDPDAGLIAAVDSRGLPLWVDLRVGTATVPGRGKLRELASVDGSNIFGVGIDGAVARFNPSGNWLLKTPQPARFAFPQSNGTVLILGGRGDATRAWRAHPPEASLDTLPLPNVSSGVGARLGERIFFVRPPATVLVVRARTLSVDDPIAVPHRISTLATTPSGDRAYVVMDSTNELVAIDPYQNRIASRTTLPGKARDLRVDPFGRFLLVRAATGDSVWVVSIGTDRVVETVHSQWRGDLPLVTIDGAIALTDGKDVVLHARTDKRVPDGASDFWYPFVWNGLRPRAASLDQPPPAPTTSDTAAPAPAVTAETTTAPAAPPPVDSARVGFTLSFNVLLDEARARDEASKIVVNGENARVVAGIAAGTAVYRVVLGPYATRDEAERVGKASGRTYVVYAGAP